MNDCIHYKPSMIDLIIPSYTIFFQLCISFDKTKLILVSLIRLIIFIYIFSYLMSKNWIEWNVEKIPQMLGYLLLGFYVVINVVYIIILLIKKPAIDKDELEETATNVATTLKQVQLSEEQGQLAEDQSKLLESYNKLPQLPEIKSI